jgi:hypothetical protein
MTIVRFVRHWQAYNSGETAGFLPAIADNLCKQGVAVLVAAGEEAPAVADAPVIETVAETSRRGRPRKG